MKYPNKIDILQIPKNLIYEVDIGSKRISVFCYLLSRKVICGNFVNFSIENMMETLGYSMRTSKDKFEDTLNKLEEYGYIKRIRSKKSSSLQTVFFIDNKIKNQSFCNIKIEDINKLLREKGDIKLLLLAYIKINIVRSQACYRYLSTIENDTGISYYHIIKELEELKIHHLINFKIPEKYQIDNGTFKNIPAVFCEYGNKENSDKIINCTIDKLKS